MARTEGEFWLNQSGGLVHPDLIPADKKLEDEIVTAMVDRAAAKAADLAQFREASFAEAEDFFDLLLQNYNLKRESRSKKGAITLTDYSGLSKVEIATANRLSFDSKLKIAKLKIDEYLTEACETASPEIKTLILRAFEVDKKGDVDAKKILALKGYAITHPKWVEAVGIIGEATRIVGSKRYIRFYRRENQTDEWEHISLELSNAKAKAGRNAKEAVNEQADQ
jgi:hypothetical protein